MGRASIEPARGVRIFSKTSYALTFDFIDPRAPDLFADARWRPHVATTNAHDKENIKWVNAYLARIKQQIHDHTFDPIVEFPGYSRSKKLAEVIKDNTITVAKVLNDYIKSDEAIDNTKSYTLKKYREKVENIFIPAFGDVPADNLTRPQVQDALVKNRGRIVSKKTIGNDMCILRKAFIWHMGRDASFNNNIFYGWRPIAKGKKRSRPDIKPFLHDEVMAILAAVDKAYPDTKQYQGKQVAEQFRNIITVMYWEGLRISEFVGLRWDQIDFENETITIETPMIEGEEHDEAKTEQGDRTIDMYGDTKAALLSQRKIVQLKSPFVFLNPIAGIPFQSTKYFQDKFTRILKAAGVEYRAPKQLRHSWATYALAAGEDPKFVAGHLGHTDPAFTMKTYYRYVKNLYPNAGKALEKMRKYAAEETEDDIDQDDREAN